MTKKHISVIIKPTHDCNLRCTYCYIDENAENGRMTQELLEQSIKKVSDYADNSSWIWHGGEPLLMGVDFFKNVIEIQKYYQKKGKTFRNSIQTNATLITDEILNLASESKFSLGTSLDGPMELNDKTRVFSESIGGFNQIYSGIKKIKNKFGQVGTICVINKNNINEEDRLYNFFKDNKMHVKFNPLINSGKVETNFKDLSITPKEYGEFLKRMWSLYNSDCKQLKHVPIDVDPFKQVIGNMIVGNAIGCNYSGNCQEGFVSIGPQGDIYPCGRFDGISEFWMGNIKINSLEESMCSAIHKRLNSRILNTVSDCGNCITKNICNSGCMHNAYLTGDVMGKDPYCTSYKALFNVIFKELDLEGIKYEK